MEMSRIVSLAAGLTIAAVLSGGCTVTVKTQQKFTATSPVTKTEAGTWTNQDIVIENKNGNVTVNAVPGLTQITLSAVPFAFADDSAHQSDAQQAMLDVQGSITIDETTAGKVVVSCNVASKNYGTAANGTTGCDSFTVQVPAAGVALQATADNGSITAGNITGAQGKAVIIQSHNGDCTATLTPMMTSALTASSENGPVTLLLPNSFAADSITMTASNGTVSVEGFGTDFTSASKSRGAPLTGASSITATSGNGDVTVKSQ
jgi:hypothetical protein